MNNKLRHKTNQLWIMLQKIKKQRRSQEYCTGRYRRI